MTRKLAPYLIVAIVSIYGTWAVTDYKHEQVINQLNLAHHNSLQAVSVAANEEAEKAKLESEQLRQQAAALDEKHTKELADAQKETSALRDAVDTGAKRLHIATQNTGNNCSSVSRDTGTNSSNDAAGAELDPTARRAYNNLRTALDTVQAQLNECQDYVRVIQGSAEN